MSSITTKPYNSLTTRLSLKSLELCTESLGSETGTETIFIGGGGDSVQEPSKVSKLQNSPCEERTTVTRKKKVDSRIRSSSFPPPLTTMRGSNSLKVVMVREKGRLVVEAVERPLTNGGVLQAERSGGRLRLCFLNSTAEELGGAVEEGCGGGGDEVVEEVNGPPSEGVCGGDELEKDVGGDGKYKRMSRCKDGGQGHGGNNNRSDDNHWNKPSLWIAT